MRPKNYYELMAKYNLWMNEKLYVLCSNLTDEERKKDVRAPFTSIHGMFNHLLFGDRAWMKRFTGKNYYNKPVGEILYENFEEMKCEHLAIAREIIEWSSAVSEEWLSGPFRFESQIYKRTWVMPAWIFVTHMFNHQTHHRGQLTALLEQRGMDFGVTDIPLMEGLVDVS